MDRGRRRVNGRERGEVKEGREGAYNSETHHFVSCDAVSEENDRNDDGDALECCEKK